MLNVKRDLIGKTITGIIAVPPQKQPDVTGEGRQPCEIWMMQFSDGTYVEFVSPAARKGLRRSAGGRSMTPGKANSDCFQLALNVA